MSENYRHHHAVRTEYVFVPVPYEVGSPKQKYLQPPGQYPRQGRDAWRPAQDIPRRLSKAEKVANYLDFVRHNDQAAREFLAETRRISAAMRNGVSR